MESQTATSPPDPYLTVGEVAALLDVSPETVRNIERRGELTSIRTGANRVRLFARTDVQALATQRKGGE